jgi:ABC-2 type transport system ATP-binding protein
MPMRRERGGIAEAVRRLDSGGVGIADIAVRRPTLDDVFMVLTGHVAEEETGEGDEPEPVPEREEAAA